MVEVVDEIETEAEAVAAPNGNGAGPINQDVPEVEPRVEGVEDEQPPESEDEDEGAGDGRDAANGRQEDGVSGQSQHQHLAPEVHVGMETEPGVTTPNPPNAEDEQVESEAPTSLHLWVIRVRCLFRH